MPQCLHALYSLLKTYETVLGGNFTELLFTSLSLFMK